MKKRLLAMLLAGAMIFGLAACGNNEGSTETPDAGETTPAGTEETGGEAKTVKVGMICIGDENDQGYTYNFIRGMEDTKAKLAELGIETGDWVVKYNIGEDSTCEDANIELAEAGCDIIFNTSYGFEDYMLKVAADYHEIQFVGCTNQQSAVDDLDNTHNAFANIYEGRYLAGVVGGMKLQQMIDEGTITEDQAIIGYVGAYPYAEVISGFTAFYLGAKSVCPSATMKVKYVNSWSDATEEANAAKALCDEGCVLISQHSDNTTPATAAQEAGAFHCGYNNDMTGVAPDASLISTRIDWSVYMTYAISAVANGENFDQDWTDNMADGAVVLTELNEAIAAPGTTEAIEKAEADLAGGMHVFAGPLSGHDHWDTSLTWSIGEGEYFAESDLSQDGGLSAPQFTWIIDGITEE